MSGSAHPSAFYKRVVALGYQLLRSTPFIEGALTDIHQARICRYLTEYAEEKSPVSSASSFSSLLGGTSEIRTISWKTNSQIGATAIHSSPFIRLGDRKADGCRHR